MLLVESGFSSAWTHSAKTYLGGRKVCESGEAEDEGDSDHHDVCRSSSTIWGELRAHCSEVVIFLLIVVCHGRSR